MKHKIKNRLIFFSLIVLSAAVLAGCGKRKEEAETEAETYSAEHVELDACIGTVTSVRGESLSVMSESGELLNFDIADAARKNRSSIVEGYDVAIIYTGVLSGQDTSRATVQMVIGLDSDVVSAEASSRGQMSGQVTEYYEGGRLVVRSSATNEEFYFSTESMSLKGADTLFKGDTVTVIYVGDINGDELVSAVDVEVKNSVGASGGETSSVDPVTAALLGSDSITGTVREATMNAVTIQTDSGTRYTFSTMEAEIRVSGGLAPDMKITLYYTGDLNSGAENVTVTSVESVN